jgi:DNA-binding XRE family transcriptional regulator
MVLYIYYMNDICGPLCGIYTTQSEEEGTVTERVSTRTDAEWMGEVGRRLRRLRTSRKLTLVEVAERSGLDRVTVSRAEKGDNPTLHTLTRLLRVYGRLDGLQAMVPEPLPSPLAALDEERERDDHA